MKRGLPLFLYLFTYLAYYNFTLTDHSKHMEALELVNRLNKNFFEERFFVSDPYEDGLEKIEMKRYYSLQAYSSPEDWTEGII